MSQPTKTDHALLSPSSAHRWLKCTPSAVLEKQFPNTTSEAAEEGTLAHALGELEIQKKLKLVTPKQYKAKHAEIALNGYYNGAMQQYCDEFAAYVIEEYLKLQAITPDTKIFLEQKLNLGEYMPNQFGTGDVVIVSDNIMHIIDLKYGKGVKVNAENNSQMKLYALGALSQFDYIYAINTVVMCIYQPRIDNISEWSIDANELKAWGQDFLKPKAAVALKGEGDYEAGEHCRFCKAKAVCRANADHNLEIAKYDFKDPSILTPEEISDIITRQDEFTKWLTAVDEYALAEALKGNVIPNYKLVEGRANRKYADEDSIIKTLSGMGFKEEKILQPRKLLSITEMEKLLGKNIFNESLSKYVVKPEGKPTLAPLSDKRQEFNGKPNVNDLFN